MPLQLSRCISGGYYYPTLTMKLCAIAVINHQLYSYIVVNSGVCNGSRAVYNSPVYFRTRTYSKRMLMLL